MLSLHSTQNYERQLRNVRLFFFHFDFQLLLFTFILRIPTSVQTRISYYWVSKKQHSTVAYLMVRSVELTAHIFFVYSFMLKAVYLPSQFLSNATLDKHVYGYALTQITHIDAYACYIKERIRNATGQKGIETNQSGQGLASNNSHEAIDKFEISLP